MSISCLYMFMVADEEVSFNFIAATKAALNWGP
jgi:hypothetical protein